MPFTFSQIPTNPKHYKFGNNFAGLTMYLPLEADIKKACSIASKKMNDIKRSIIPMGYYALISFYNVFFAQAFVADTFKSSGQKHTLILSNVPGFLKPVYYGGGCVKRFFSLITGPGSCSTCISVVSILKRVSICVTSDSS